MLVQNDMLDNKSEERLAFEYYIRAGRRLVGWSLGEIAERKFNPYHDPRDGRFTFAPGGPRSLRHILISNGGGLRPARQEASQTRRPTEFPLRTQSDAANEAIYRPNDPSPLVKPAAFRANPRARIGGNGGPPLNDPMTLE